MRLRIGKFFWFVLTVVLCVAPWIERAHGTAFIIDMFYGHWAFLLLWCVGIGYGIYLTIRSKAWRKWDVFLLHSAVFLVLIGAVFHFFNSKLSISIGKWITYLGFLQFVMGYLFLLLKKDGRFRTLLRRLSIATLLIGVFLPNIFSQRTVSKIDAKKIGAEVVWHEGRQTPFRSVCDEWLRQLYGQTHYHNFSSVEVAMGWILYPKDWMGIPFMKVPTHELRAKLQSGKYASPQDFFNSNGDYIFENQLFENKEKADTQLALLQAMRWNGLQTIPPQQVENPFKMKCEYFYLVVRPWISSGLLSGILAALSFFVFFKTVVQNHITPFFTNFKKILHAVVWMMMVVVWLHWLLRWYLTGHIPLGTGYDSLLFLTGLILLISTLLWNKYWLISIAGLGMTALALLATRFSFNSPQLGVLPDALQTPWLSIHVTVAMMAYAGLSLTFFLSIIYFIMKKKNAVITVLQNITDLSQLLLLPSVGLLALGIMLGAVWAQQAWGSYWTWDPKEVWALITFMVYAPAVQPDFFRRFKQNGFYHIYILLVFSFVMMTYFGVNVLFGGMHSY